jgi:hypothetical protein
VAGGGVGLVCVDEAYSGFHGDELPGEEMSKLTAKQLNSLVLDPNCLEVEWLDENGGGHQTTFAVWDEETMKTFIKALEPVSSMIAVYKVYKVRQ